jgi:DNA-directed RNA polymerase specialized sigma24 family protein
MLETAQQISPRMREVAVLVAGKGLSYPETAQELGISVTTVKRYAEEIGKRFRKAPRKAMFEWYRTHGDEDEVA